MRRTHGRQLSHVTLLVIVAWLSSCGVTPHSLQYSELTIVELCSIWREDPLASAELEERAHFLEREWSAIRNQKLFVGMSEEAAVCSRGMPYSGSWSFPAVMTGDFSSSWGANGWVRSEEGEWGLRRIYLHDTQTGPDEMLWIFVENGVVVHFSHGTFQEVSDGRDGLFKDTMFDFNLLKPSRKGAWYTLPD